MRAISVAALLAAAGLLTACGGGDGPSGGDGGGGGGGGGSGGSELPSSALQSSDALVAYVKSLIGSGTSETAAPVKLGDVTLPVTDTGTPASAN